MFIEHIAMYVNDLDAEKDFFTNYFDARCGELYHNKKSGFKSYFLTFKNGSRLEIMTAPEMREFEKPINRTGFIHIAFKLESRNAVDTLTDRIRGDGYKVISAPRITGDGYYESCVLDAEGNQIEITA